MECLGWLAALAVMAIVARDARAQVYYQPEQVHLSYGSDPTEMVVTWTTYSDTSASTVEYGQTGLQNSVNGTSKKFVDGGPQRAFQFIHRVRITGLVPGQKYYYHCGSEQGWSDLYFFSTMRSGSDWGPRLLVYGDMGNYNAQSLPRLQEETQTGNYDAVIHVGDFAYNMDTDNGRVGDEFMRQIQPIAAYLPYMTCVGNHEQAYNFSHYKARFSMPGNEENLFYSWNMGPVHFIAISTEFYYEIWYGVKQITRQYHWLERDLQEATKRQNRDEHPWIVLYGHRPMYCSNSDDLDCTVFESLVRVGVPFLHWYGLERLLYEYGVDLAIWAHEHSYERLWPVYDRKVYNGSTDAYTNPGAPVHITTGSAGCKERTDPFIKNPPEWRAFHNSGYGYLRMHVHNSTHLYTEQVSDDQGGKVIDSMWLIKNRHGPYGIFAEIDAWN